MAQLTRYRSPSLLGESLLHRNPLAIMREMQRDMARWFSESTSSSDAEWCPAIEARRENGAIVVCAELPGVQKEDVHVEITDNALHIAGDRKYEKKIEEKDYLLTERSYGHFERTIGLPEGADAEQIKAEMKDGILEVRIPVTETKSKTREVPILEAAKK
jgi:HSP20 family protein